MVKSWGGGGGGVHRRIKETVNTTGMKDIILLETQGLCVDVKVKLFPTG